MLVQRSVAFIAAVSILSGALPAQAATRHVVTPPRRNVIAKGTLSNGSDVRVSANGFATISKGNAVQIRHVPPGLRDLADGPGGVLDANSTKEVMSALEKAQPQTPYVPGVVNVVFRDGISPSKDIASFQPAIVGLVPSYTNDVRTNAALQRLGVNNLHRIASSINRSRLSAWRSTAGAADRSLLNLANAYQLHLTGSNVLQAVRKLRALQGVAYAAPDWIVSTANIHSTVLDTSTMPSPSRVASLNGSRWAQFTSSRSGRAAMQSLSSADVPANYSVSTSSSSWLNAPGVDDVAAYDEIAKAFPGQLPGTGEIITNVSVGDVCNSGSEPSSHLINGQNYLDVAGLPLIPEYVADYDANLSGSDQVCGVDPNLGEVLLDFSVMAPLPDGFQRPGAIASGKSDLLGIAPGASYRLIVPSDTSMSASAFAAAFIAAAGQTPAPNVITASLGWGVDGAGFPGRYLEEDPLLHSVLSTIVNSQNIVVCISANDGTRLYTNVAIGSHGGSAPTNVTTDPSQVTDLNDIVYSTAPSVVTDTGVIDVGGTTTDDISAANPADPQNAQYVSQLTWPEVRWDGAMAFSSGYGTRVNISAPSDAIPALELTGSGYNKTQLVSSGGTSAAAPQVAAAAAVMMQVARLTGHPFTSATDVRNFLVSNAVPVPNVPQADMPINVGPQLNVRRGVEKLLANANMSQAPAVNRIAVAQRQLYKGTLHCGTGGFQENDGDEFVEATDPTYIHLDDLDGCGVSANRNLNSPITFAPDWENIPSGAKFKLFLSGHPNQLLGTGPWTRLWPQQLLAAAGIPVPCSQQRTISLTYQATLGPVLIASTAFDITLAPTPATSRLVSAPVVAPVITGSSMTVSYDYSGIDPSQLNSPVIEVSMPGRMSPDSAPYFSPIYTSPVLTSPKGTITIPVSALGGAGIYGVAINLYQQPLMLIDHAKFSLFAYTRVVATNSARPAAPLLSQPGDTTTTHGLGMSGHGSFNVQYDVSNVPGATNALLEISASGPNLDNNMNPFNNPNGSQVDSDGIDTGSVYAVQLTGTSGTVTLNDKQANLVPGMIHAVRVIPEMGTVGIGEASDISVITMPAFMSPDGNSLENGFAINPSGDDGVFTSAPMAGSTTYGISQIGTFSQSLLTYGKALNVAQDPRSPYSLAGYVANDTMVYQVGQIQTQAPSFLTYAVATGARTTTPVTPVPQGWTFLEAGTGNSVSAITAMLCSQIRGTNLNLGVLTANVKAGTSTAFIQLSPPFTNPMNTIAATAHIDYDPTGNMGYVFIEGEPANGNGFSATDDILATVNFSTGTVTYAHLGDFGSIKDFIVDPAKQLGFATVYANNIHAAYQGGNFLVIDLAAATVKNVVNVPLAQTYSSQIDISKLALDPVNGLIAVQNPLPRADDTDNNPLSEIDFFDESGNFVKSTGRLFNLTSFTKMNHWFQLNPTTRTGFTFDNTQTQIIPFPY